MKPYYEQDGITIYHGDCCDLLPSLPPCDLLLTDPPYGIGEKWANQPINTKKGASRLWVGDTWDAKPISQSIIDAAIGLSKRAVVWGGHYYAMPPSRCWLVWDKLQEFSGADCELAWTNFDQPARVFRMSRIDAYQNTARDRKTHPTEKPVALVKWCIKHAGDVATILDPFAGTGSTAVAAKAYGLQAVLVEAKEQYCEIAAKRLAQGALPLDIGS